MSTWVDLDTDAHWHSPPMIHCDLCGRMIAKRFLRTETEGGPRTFCGEGCAQLYEDYWLAERGSEPHPADIGATYARLMVK